MRGFSKWTVLADKRQIESRKALSRELSLRRLRGTKAIVIEPALPGRFQIQNALTAATAATLLAERGFPISDEAIISRYLDGAMARPPRATFRSPGLISRRHA